MPIRAENKDRYPPSWPEISRRIRFERAQGRCECTGECGADHAKEEPCWDDGWTRDDMETRCAAEHGYSHPVTRSTVVLTVAHLPGHEVEDCGDEALKAMCQRCHNKMDAPERRRGIVERLRAMCAIGDLFA